jgi:acyl-coenzyme A thioesterase PaaI-like protein
MKAASVLNKLINRKDAVSKMALNNLLKIAIPFNAPHGFTVLEISDEQVRIKIANRKLNHNHLGGIHACAIATLGEFCAGMTMAKKLGLDQYRLILSQLSVEYYLQGRSDLTGIAKLSDEKIQKLHNELSTQDKTLVHHETEIFNQKNEKVALVKTTWQLKKWDKVQLK